ncbi:AAA family ATPase [Arthrospira platensis SPKY2]
MSDLKFNYGSLAEKYRPVNWNDIIGVNRQYIENLKYFISNDISIPGILIVGPSGSGKTTLAQLIGRTINCYNRKKGSAEPCGYCDVCLGLSTTNNHEITIERAADKEILERLINISSCPPYIVSSSSNGEKIINDNQRNIIIINEIQQLSGKALQEALRVLEPEPFKKIHTTWILTSMNIDSLGGEVSEALKRRCHTYKLGFHSDVEIKKRFNQIFPNMDKLALEGFSKLNNRTMGEAWSNFNLIHPRYNIENITEEVVYEVLGGGCTPKSRVELYNLLYKKDNDFIKLINLWRSNGLDNRSLNSFILGDIARYSIYINDDKEQDEILKLMGDIYSCYDNNLPIEYALLSNSNKLIFGVLGKCNKTDKNSNVKENRNKLNIETNINNSKFIEEEKKDKEENVDIENKLDKLISEIFP